MSSLHMEDSDSASLNRENRNRTFQMPSRINQLTHLYYCVPNLISIFERQPNVPTVSSQACKPTWANKIQAQIRSPLKHDPSGYHGGQKPLTTPARTSVGTVLGRISEPVVAVDSS